MRRETYEKGGRREEIEMQRDRQRDSTFKTFTGVLTAHTGAL